MNALALRRSIVAVFVLLFATSASAVISSGSVSILIDADRNAATGCRVTAGQVTYGGIEFVVKTSFDAMVVTGVTTQQCVNGVLGGPVTIDTGGWNVGTGAGTLYLETAFPVSLLGGPHQARYVFVAESGSSIDVVDSNNGAPIFFPPERGAGRHRVVVPPSLLAIILDGIISDWRDLRPLVADAAGTGIPAFRISNIYLIFSRGKFFLRFDLEVNASAPTARDDSYSVIKGGGLNQAASSGVLANDINPPGNGTMTAVKLSDPLHGTVTLNPDGSFTYFNDGSSAVSDSFTYKAHNSAGDSNPATVTITIIQGNAPAFTSANATTFKVGVAGNFLVTTTGTAPVSLTRSGTLPTGVSFTDNGNGTATLSGTPGAGSGGTYIFQITASNIVGQDNQTFTLTVQQGPAITTAAANQTVCPGATATFTAAASGFPAPSVQWRVSTNGGATFTDIPGATTTTLSFTANAAQNGNLYRAVFTNSMGTAQTTATLTVNSGPPAITTNPANQTVCAGANATFTAAASGVPAPTIQWQVSSGGSFTNISGATSGTLTFATTAADNGKQYRAMFTNSCGTTPTTAATLTVNTAPVVMTNPLTQTVCDNTSVSFTAASSGSPAPTVQWQVSTGGPFADIPGATSTTLTFTATIADNGKQYHAVFTNSCGTATTTAAVLNVITAPAVTTNPANQAVCAGTSATFTAASSIPTATVQWQFSADGGATFNNISGANSTTLSFITSIGENGNRYRAVFSNSCGTATTTSALLTVFVAPAVTAEPTNQAACDGASVSFTSTAGGNPAPTVQWQVSTDGGTTFNDISGKTSTTLTFNAAVAQNGNLYHAVFTNSCGTATSANASLTVNTPPTVTTNPLTQAVCNGSSVSFIAAASGSPAPTVQWQISTDAGVTFTDIPGATSTTYTFTAALTDNGHQYRAVFTNSCSPPATTAAATLTVDDTLTISTQPADQTVCTPNSATFTAAASGPSTVKWQVSSGGPFTDIPGATSTTLTFTPALADSGKQYRAVFTNSCSTATTNAATLTVHAPPAVTTQPTNQTVCNGATATFTAAASGTPAPTVQWQVSSGGGPFTDIAGATSTTLTFTAASADNGKQYRAVFTNSCSTATTNAATLTVSTVVISPAAGALTAAIYHAGYSQTFTASGGTAPYTYAISPATPPVGLSFNTSTGVLSGSAPTLPDNTGNFSFSISATDSNGCQHSQSYTLEVKPGATNDTYSNVVGNTQAWVSSGTTTQPATPAYTLTGSVLANDVAPVGATASAGGTTTNGGSVAVASDGTFLYTPPVGTITNDTFTYTITSNGATNTALVIIQFNNRVWWVKNNAAPGDGRSNTPFNTLSSAGSSSAVNDIIFVYAGDGTTTNQNSGITLKSNQLLTGEALALMVNGQTLVAAGSTPLIGNSGGAVITVANGDFIQGLNITAVNTAGISVGAGVTGTTSIGTVSITASASASGIFIAGGSSNLTWTNGGITISAPGSAGAGVNATGGSGNITLTNVPINVNAGGTGATGAAGVAIASKTGGGLTLNGGSTVTAGTAGSRQIVPAISLSGNSGVYSFTNKLDLWTTGGTATGFLASNSGTLTTTDTTSTIDAAGSPAINVQNTTIGAGNLNFRTVSANGGANGIVLNNTGGSGGLTVTGTGSANSGGTIQNTSGAGIRLTSTTSPSFNEMNIQNTALSGISGTQVTNFTFTNGVINNSGNIAAPVDNRSNIGFGFQALVTENNVSGVVTITGNTLTNAYEHGIDIQNFAGTISNATISGNTVTSSTSSANSHGSAIRLLGFGSSGGVSNVTKATISNNTITNFPGGAGITAQYGNVAGAPAGVWGTPGSATNVILIQGNLISGQSAANPMGANAILMTLTGNGQANWKADSNGTVANPIANIGGTEIGVTIRGVSSVATCDITNNRITGIVSVAAQAIAYAADYLTTTTDAPQLSGTISGNVISGQDGEGIQALATPGSSAHVSVTISNNSVTAPNCGGCNRYGITAQVGSSSGTTTGNPSMCLKMLNNTSAGSGVNTGIGIRKKTAAYVFNIDGYVSGPVDAYIAGNNPSGGGVTLISQTTGFGSCTAP